MDYIENWMENIFIFLLQQIAVYTEPGIYCTRIHIEDTYFDFQIILFRDKITKKTNDH